MLLELACITCESPNVIIDDNEYGTVVICKNPKCDDFDCFVDLSKVVNKEFGKNLTIEEGLTGELIFENEQGKFHEVYENGIITKCEKVD